MISNSIIDWLLEKSNPSIRYRTLTELLEKKLTEPNVIESRMLISESKQVQNILARMHPEGYWLQKNPRTNQVLGDGVEYGGFATTHFCLSYLAELGLDKEHPSIEKSANRYLTLQKEDGDFFRHLSCLYGYNIRTFVRLGYRNDPRLEKTIRLMLNTERCDGGYLCDMHDGKYKKKSVKSCIRGSVKALLAFSELPDLWEHERCKKLIAYFLEREALFKKSDLLIPVNRDVITTSYPFTWGASLTEILFALSKMGYGNKIELDRAWKILETKKDDYGKYVLDWTQTQSLFKAGKRGASNKWITFYSLLALKYRDFKIA